MYTPFRNTLRQLSLDDGAGSRAVGAAGAVVVGLWLAWGLFGSLSQRLPSRVARVESVAEAVVIEAPVGGVVAGVLVHAGEPVAAGALLARLDPSPRQIELAEAEARLAAVEAMQRAAGDLGQAAAGVAAAGAQAAVARAAALGAQIAAQDAILAQALAEQGALSALVAQGAAEAISLQKADQSVVNAQASLDALRQQRAAALAEAEIARLGVGSAGGAGDRDAAGLQAEAAAARARVSRLRAELAQGELRSPIDGRFAEEPLLAVGATVAPGARLGRVVPAGPLHVVAFLDPIVAIGRVAPGQPVEIVVEGAAETRLLPLAGRVERVAAEADPQGLRVEIALEETRALPLVHGAVVAAEVEVDRAAPLVLLWRLVGGR